MRILGPAIFLAIIAGPAASLAADVSRPAARQPEPQPPAPRSPWSAYIALGGGMMPEFPGSKDYKFMPIGIGRLAYHDYYIEVVGPRAKINVIPGGMFEAGPLVGYDGGRDSDVKNRRVKLLPEVDSSVEFGGFAKVNFKQVMMPTDTLSFGVEFAKASEGHEGYTASLKTSYGIQIAKPFFVSVDAEIEFADKKYSNAYFGVTPVGAAASGLPTYTASAGLTKAEIGLNARYLFSPNWGITGRVAYGRLLGDAAKSPIVKQEGSANQFSTVVGVLYRF
ncbi:MipA/OmpV family protein [Bosea sp. 124]|uniref:MipA/OmpV family protein n=1 Tax=Bosea sp. 124 TaxID=2135642 RepID=UPI000D343FE5|nr:MipA/OmpV family protein [Bosea sp. 124]PTM42771.1 outer membrane scaffolding protein for murein synthesis (MipA/OmpV family) [Bosea sp. 124]